MTKRSYQVEAGSCFAGLERFETDIGLTETKLQSVDDDIAISNTLTGLLAVTEKLLPHDQRQPEKPEREDLDVRKTKTMLLDAIALALTKDSAVTAVAATWRMHGTDIWAAESNSDDESGSKAEGFKLHQDSAIPIRDFKSLLTYVASKNISFSKHAATLGPLLSIPPASDGDGFRALPVHYFVTATCVRKLLRKFEHSTGEALLEWMGETLIKDSPTDPGLSPEIYSEWLNASGMEDVPLRKTTDEEGPELETLKEKIKSISDLKQYSPAERQMIVAFPKRLFGPPTGTPTFPFLYQLVLHQSLLGYRDSLLRLSQCIDAVRLNPNSIAESVENFTTQLNLAVFHGNVLASIEEGTFLKLHLRRFKNPVDLLNRVRDVPSQVDSSMGNAGEASQASDPVQDGGFSEPEEEEEELERYNANGTPKSPKARIAELIGQIASKEIAADILQQHAGKFPLTISAISAPAPSAELRPLAEVLRIVYRFDGYKTSLENPTAAKTPSKSNQPPLNESKSPNELTLEDKVAEVVKLLDDSVEELEKRSNLVKDYNALKDRAKFPGKLHCECLLALALLYPKIVEGKNASQARESLRHAKHVLGVSKRCCPACTKTIALLGGLTVGGAHGTWHLWSMPRWLSASIRRQLIEYFSKVLVKRLQILRDSRRNSTSSDHSATSESIDSQSLRGSRRIVLKDILSRAKLSSPP